MGAKADLHVHSRYSDQPSEWLLRRAGAPESYTEPLEVYNRCRQRGMDFVTITDHDTLAGALEIAHLPGTFLSSEVTAAFPEDGCQVHLLVYGVTESQFRDIERLRGNLYELRDYLYEQDVVCSVAHLLFQVNDALTVDHVEKLLVLFKRFEGINGARDPRAAAIVRAILGNLTPQQVDRLADRHDLDPRDTRPWVKYWTGGSDDHSGLTLASAWTETPPAAGVGELFTHLRRGDHQMAGEPGSSLKLARCFLSLAYRYTQDQGGGGRRRDLLAELLRQLAQGERPVALGRKARLWLAGARLARVAGARVRESQLAMAGEVAQLAAGGDEAPGTHVERRCFELSARLAEGFLAKAVAGAAGKLAGGDFAAAFDALTPLAPAALAASPYLAAFHSQHQDERLLQQVAARFAASRPLTFRSRRKAWFTDTLAQVNGVARTLREVAAVARRRGAELTLVTSSSATFPDELAVKSYPPVAELELPEYESIPLAVPPLLQLIEECERRRYAEILVSTPGPVGLAGVAVARLLGLRLTGIYHTDFPVFVRQLTSSPGLEGMTWSFMRWFYDQMDVLYVRSRAYLEQLAGRGFDRGRMRVLPGGVDCELFSPAKRRGDFFRRFGLSTAPTFLYVGRVSREKNLDALLNAFAALTGEGLHANLAVVGDGPYLEELRSRYRLPGLAFTGFLAGEELAAAYASGDLFVFPSTCDTFGNAVLEAQASGVPAIVSNLGGPQEIVAASGAGRAVDVRAPGELARAMGELMADAAVRTEMGRAAVAAARRASWEAVFEELWHSAESPAAAEPEAPGELWRRGRRRAATTAAAAGAAADSPQRRRMAAG